MAHEYNGTALGGDDVSQLIEQLSRLIGSQNRRRLVKQDDRRIASEAFDDLHSLTQAGGQVANSSVGIDGEPVLVDDLTNADPHCVWIEWSRFAERNVLPDRQRLDQTEVLMDHSYAICRSHHRIEVVMLLSADGDRPRVWDDEPDQYFHQRRLTGPVLTEDAVDPAVEQREVDVITRDNAAISLGDTRQLDRRGRQRSAVGPCRVVIARRHPL